MKIIKITCPDSDICMSQIKAKYPQVTSVSHIPNNHIVTFPEDYDNKGGLDNNIHELCWQLGGIKKTARVNGERAVIPPRALSKNPLYSTLASITENSL